MAARTQMLGRPYREKELRSEAARLAGFSDPDELCTQQNFSKITRNLTSESTATPALAAALGVNALWLQHGQGPATLLDTALTKQLK